MSNSTYQVPPGPPTQIYPAGLQQDLSVLNTGTVTVYLTDTNAPVNGVPLAAGNPYQWPANTPLYAYSAEALGGANGAVLISPGTVLPYGAVGVSGPVVGIGQADLLLNDGGAGPHTSPTFYAGAYQTLTLNVFNSAPAGGSYTSWYRLYIAFLPTAGGTAFKTVEYIIPANSASGGTVITLPVAGPYVSLSWTTSGGPGATGITLSAVGSTSVLPACYITNGTGPTVYATELDDVIAGYYARGLVALAAGATLTLQLPSRSGPARVTVEYSLAAAPTLGGLRVASGLAYNNTLNAPALAGVSSQFGGLSIGGFMTYELIVPNAPMYLVIQNGTDKNANVTPAIAYTAL